MGGRGWGRRSGKKSKISVGFIIWNRRIVVSPHGTQITILKILGTLTRNICDGVSFQDNLSDRLDSLNCLKNFMKDIFLGIFRNFQKRSFSLKNTWSHFFIHIKILDSNLVTLIATMSPLETFLQPFQSTNRKHFC